MWSLTDGSPLPITARSPSMVPLSIGPRAAKTVWYR
jgi:hypothetical protein